MGAIDEPPGGQASACGPAPRVSRRAVAKCILGSVAALAAGTRGGPSWADAPRADVPLTPEERKWLKDHGAHVVFAPTPNYPPVDFFDDGGEHRGIAADFLDLMEKRIPCRFERKQVGSWDEILTLARAREIDGTTIAQRTPEREKFWLFTKPYVAAPTAIVTRRDRTGSYRLQDLRGIRVGIVKGYAIDEYLAEHHPELELEPVPDDLTGLQKVSHGELEAMIADVPTATFLISKWGISNLRVAGDTGHRYRYSFAVRRDYPLLHSIMEKGLASIGEDERQAIVQRWIYLEGERFDWTPVLAVAGVIGVAGAVGVLWNWTLRREVRRQTQALRHSEEDLRVTLDSIGDAVIATDTEARVTRLNPVASALTGWPQAEAGGAALSEVLRLVGEHDRRPLPCPGRQVLSTGEVVAVSEHALLVSRQGEERHVSSSAAPIRNDAGQIVGVVLVFRDVTEERALQARLRQSQKLEAIGQLAGGVAHDFNNMLTGIISGTEMIRLKVQRSEDPGHLPSLVLDSAKRAASLTSKLLTFARKQAAVTAPVAVNATLRDALALLASTIDPRIELVEELAPGELVTTGDASLLQSAFLNLLINGANAMQDGGELVVRTRRVELEERQAESPAPELAPGSYVEVEIRDSGCGIPAEHMDRVFEPFFTTKPAGEGTGLGLSTVLGTVQQHGGSVTVESQEGEGTTFRLLLPVSANRNDSETEAEPGPPRGSGTILVVDDEEAVRTTMRHGLEELGYEVLVAADGVEGVSVLNARPDDIDLVVLDMVMPAMSGRDCFLAMKRVRPDLRCIVATGYSPTEDLEEMRRAGLTAVLRKPFVAAELGRAVHDAMTG